VLYISSYVLPYYRGDEFSKEFADLGEVQSIIPKTVNIMALTATATRSLKRSVTGILGMEDPIVVNSFSK